MRKRMTDTDIWEKKWFQELSPKHKLLWFYIKDKCDKVGIWEINYPLASFQIGEVTNESDIEKFGSRIMHLAEDKLLLVDFVEFQYGLLHPNSPPHLGVIKGIQEAYREYECISSIPFLRPYLTLSLPLGKGILTLKEEDKEEVKEEDKIKRKQFEAFLEAFPVKTHKKEAWGAFRAALNIIDYESLMGRVRLFLGGEWKGKEAKYIPNPATWLEKRRWEDEPKVKQTKSMYELKSKE